MKAMPSEENPTDCADGHVTLLAELTSTGEPLYETLPATALGDERFELRGSPGLVLGCAAGDVIRRAEDGRCTVERQGPNYCIQMFRGDAFSEESLRRLSESEAVRHAGGLLEAPPTRGFAVLTVPRRADIPAVESALDTWAESDQEIHWWYGNAE
jgi:hypothetical protein